MVSIREARTILNPQFPKLTDSNFVLTSPNDHTYNCIAWAAGDTTKWWWPGSPSTFWPIAKQLVHMDTFREAFASIGYVETNRLDQPEQFERIAIYAKDGVPTHAARQKSDGLWTSKLGQAWDISHEFDALDGGEYGQPALIMERQRDN